MPNLWILRLSVTVMVELLVEERVAERIDTMTLAITQGLSCFELSNVEFAYAPPVSMVTDPLVLAVEEVSKKFN